MTYCWSIFKTLGRQCEDALALPNSWSADSCLIQRFIRQRLTVMLGSWAARLVKLKRLDLVSLEQWRGCCCFYWYLMPTSRLCCTLPRQWIASVWSLCQITQSVCVCVFVCAWPCRWLCDDLESGHESNSGRLGCLVWHHVLAYICLCVCAWERGRCDVMPEATLLSPEYRKKRPLALSVYVFLNSLEVWEKLFSIILFWYF